MMVHRSCYNPVQGDEYRDLGDKSLWVGLFKINTQCRAPCWFMAVLSCSYLALQRRDSMRQKPAPPLSCSSRFVQLRVFWTGLCTQTEYDTTNNISLCQLWRENGRMIIYNIKFPSLENIRGIFDYEDNRISSKNHAVIFFIVIVQLFWNPEVFSLSAVPG